MKTKSISFKRSLVAGSLVALCVYLQPVRALADAGGVEYINPSNFTFAAVPADGKLTDCARTNSLLASYSQNRCGTVDASMQCQSIDATLKSEATVDYTNGDSGGVYQKKYLVDAVSKVVHPTSFSKRFDVAYADSYSFSLSSMVTAPGFAVEGSFTDAELSAETMLQLPSSYKVTVDGGEKYLEFDSKVLTCALESKRVSLVGTADVSVSAYHPMGNVVYDIVDAVYSEPSRLRADSSITLPEKDYLLGLFVGETFKRLNYILGDAKELDEVAISLRNVVLDGAAVSFSPRAVSANIDNAVSLLDPGYQQKNAPVQVIFSEVSP